MSVSLIVAFSKVGGVIGDGDKLPWSIKEDMRWFKEQTLNHVVIMGRKTFESIGKPLPNRINLVISSQVKNNHEEREDGSIWVGSLEDAITLAKVYVDEDDQVKGVFVIGGGGVYKEALFKRMVDKAYITIVDKDCSHIENPVVFPVHFVDGWPMVGSNEIVTDDGTNVEFMVLDRNMGKTADQQHDEVS